MKLILASASPRRKELLEKTHLPFVCIPAAGEETVTKETPEEIVVELSRKKAEEVAGRQTEECIVIGADTIVVKDGRLMGKPKDAADACRMLTEIAGGRHQVYTGVTLLRTGEQPECVCFAEKTEVSLYPMTEEEIRAYIAGGEPMDKAGAYGIQGDFAAYVKEIEGDYYNVVGLPVGRVYQELKKLMGADIPQDTAASPAGKGAFMKPKKEIKEKVKVIGTGVACLATSALAIAAETVLLTKLKTRRK